MQIRHLPPLLRFIPQFAQICIIFALSKFEANPFFRPVKVSAQFQFQLQFTFPFGNPVTRELHFRIDAQQMQRNQPSLACPILL